MQSSHYWLLLKFNWITHLPLLLLLYVRDICATTKMLRHCSSHRYSCSCRYTAWTSPFNIEATASHSSTKRQNQVLATSMPNTVHPIIRHPVNLSHSKMTQMVLVLLTFYDTFISDLLSFNSLIHTWRFSNRLFLLRSQQYLFNNAAIGGLKPIPENRFRETYSHHLAVRAIAVPPFSANFRLVAHSVPKDDDMNSKVSETRMK